MNYERSEQFIPSQYGEGCAFITSNLLVNKK